MSTIEKLKKLINESKAIVIGVGAGFHNFKTSEEK